MTIGPDPMIKILSMSVRLGKEPLTFQLLEELILWNSIPNTDGRENVMQRTLRNGLMIRDRNIVVTCSGLLPQPHVTPFPPNNDIPEELQELDKVLAANLWQPCHASPRFRISAVG